MRRALLPVALAVLVAGCGNDRATPIDTAQIAKADEFEDARFRAAGITMRVPSTWERTDVDAPQVASVASGAAQIAVWRYPRAEPLPRTRQELSVARTNLLAAVRLRDPAFRLQSSRIVIKRGYRGIELIGFGRNEGVQRGIRSLHAFAHGGEVVVDAFAPPKEFPRVNLSVFGPVTRSLKLRRPR